MQRDGTLFCEVRLIYNKTDKVHMIIYKEERIMKRMKAFVGIAIVLLSLTLGACAKSDNKDFSNEPKYSERAYDDSTKDMSDAEVDGEWSNGISGENDIAEYGMTNESSESIANSSIVSSNPRSKNSNDKIIHRYRLDIETEDFDNLINGIDDEINHLGGYVEDSNIGGRSYYSKHNTLRRASITVRIPKDKLDTFIGTVKDISNVISQVKSTENVTLQYVETESRKKALEIEQERVLSFLEKAENLTDMLSLEQRLTNIRFELQNYEMTLRTIDNQVDYSTVSISIEEVEEITPEVEEEEVEPTFLDEIKDGLKESLNTVTEALKEFTINVIVNLPFIIIWGTIIFILLLIFRRTYRKFTKEDQGQVQKSRNHQGPETLGQSSQTTTNQDQNDNDHKKE